MSKSKLITLTIFIYVLLLPVFLSAGTFKLPDTGQTTCYDQVGNVISCPAPGQPLAQDGSYSFNPLSYTDNGDGTVTDNNTGLVWQKEDDGQIYNWYEAAGVYNATYNPSSKDVCGELAIGWRLPSNSELHSLVNYNIPEPGPAIDSIFMNTQPLSYWSSTTFVDNPIAAFNVHFRAGGNASLYNKGTSIYIRCVDAEGFPAHNFTDNGNGTVADNNTGLGWQQGETVPMTWESALSYCEGLSFGGYDDWRLPNIKELESITDYTRYNPAIDTTFFLGAYSTAYWSSTTMVTYPDIAWTVGLKSGGVGNGGKGGNHYLRCVRGGQVGPPPPAYGNLEVSPSSHDFGEVAVELCSAPQQFTLSNTGNGDLTISEIALSDNENFELSINALQCEKSIQPGGSCSFDVYFCPKNSGNLSANLTITSDDPDSPTFEVPITGTGISTTKGWVVVIDGVHIPSILDPNYQPDDPLYLKKAIDDFDDWTMQIEQAVGTIFPFVWSRDIYKTEDTVLDLSRWLEKLTNLTKKNNSRLVVLAHSWGTVLAYLAISENNNIFVDKFITLGSPLNTQNSLVNSVTRSYVERVEPLSNVKEWHNYWAKCDPISGNIPAVGKNNYRDNKIYFGLTPFQTIENCHSSYFTNEKKWTKILKDVLERERNHRK